MSVNKDQQRPTMGQPMPVLVYAYHAEGYGGFDWCPDTAENRAVLRDALILDLSHANYQTGTLVTLTIKEPAENREHITEFLEGEWQDAIETGRVGHILARYSLEV